MSLRIRFTLSFGIMLLVCLVATTWLAYRELVNEPYEADTPPEDRHESESWRLFEVLARGSIPVVILACGTWYLARRVLSPIERLTDAADRMSRGNLNDIREPLPLTGRQDELDTLTTSFNRMSERVGLSFQQIREFTLHASHELKTPLTVLRASLERELAQTEDSDPRHESLLTRLDEISRLTKIVDGLSMLTRADASMLDNACDQVALHELVRDLIEDLGALAESEKLEISVDRCDEITLIGDRHRLRQLLLILADNAVKYNRPGGWIKVSLSVRPTEIQFTIRNSGNAVPPEHCESVFDRFFRGDRAASRTIGGCGLGLSIAKSIVEAHKGTITFRSSQDDNQIQVNLPRAAA